MLHAGRIHRHEFIQICGKLVDFAKGVRQKKVRAMIRNKNLRACKETRLGREALAEDKSEVLPLPFDCIQIPSSRGEVEYLDTTTGFLSMQKPPQDPRTFSSMAFTAARILVPCLSMALEYMSSKELADEYLQSCESVLEAASSFRLLEGESGPTELSDLDALLAISRASPPKDQELIPASYSSLEYIQPKYYALLREIQGFASSLWKPDRQRGLTFDRFVLSNLFELSTWEPLYMKHRVNNIEDQARSCKEFVGLIQECREWRKLGGGPLEEADAERRRALKDLRTSHSHWIWKQPTSWTKAKITNLAISGLRKRMFRKSRCINYWLYIAQPLKIIRTNPVLPECLFSFWRRDENHPD